MCGCIVSLTKMPIATAASSDTRREPTILLKSTLDIRLRPCPIITRLDGGRSGIAMRAECSRLVAALSTLQHCGTPGRRWRRRRRRYILRERRRPDLAAVHAALGRSMPAGPLSRIP
jgi:hypothetical protein